VVAGGTSANPTWEVFDPSTLTFALDGNTAGHQLLNTTRSGQLATRFANGKVLLVGGIDVSTPAPPDTTPAANTTPPPWTAGPSLLIPRYQATGVYDPSTDQYLIIGGSALGPAIETVRSP